MLFSSVGERIEACRLASVAYPELRGDCPLRIGSVVLKDAADGN